MADFDPQPVALSTPGGLPVDHPQAFDHRVCDGAEATAFLTALGALVADPDTILLRRCPR